MPLSACLALFAAAALAFWPGGGARAQGADATPAYVGSQACADCHRSETEAWADSHHAWAWKLPDGDNVLGDFSGREITVDGVTSRFFRRDGAPFIETEGADGEIKAFEVLGTVGVEPLQQYLLATGPGRLQVPDLSWDTREKRWFTLYPALKLPPGDGLHWTGAYKNWNGRCAECHATGFRKNYRPKTRSYASEMTEIGVGCESCHGPGAAHLAWASGARDDRPAWLTERGFTIGYDPRAPGVEIEQCAGCHARRSPLGDGNPIAGTAFDDAYRLAKLRAGLYEPDGGILDEVYVYGSFLQSKMNARGVRCSDCHDPHAAKLKARGNAVCTQCHNPQGNPRFPTLPLANYDDPAHHFHQPGGEGAQCKSCHMAERVYMQVDPRRDHSFRVPRPDVSRATGAPNACNDCHKDRDAGWAAAEIAARFPDSPRRGPHFATAFAAARQGDPGAAEALIGIAEHDGLPGIVRATALDLLGGAATPDIAARMASLFGDPDPLVRAAAVALQQATPPIQRAQALAGMLEDESRLVRIEAARLLLDAPIARMPARMQAAMRRAMGEFRASLSLNADFPETQIALGGVALTMRNLPAAESAFAESLRLDPQRGEIWAVLARIRAARGDRAGVAAAIRDGLAANPGDPGLAALRAQMAQ